jgi:hypothetical protein
VLTPAPTTEVETLVRSPIYSAMRRIALRHFRPGNNTATNQLHPMEPARPIKLRSIVHKADLFNPGQNKEGVEEGPQECQSSIVLWEVGMAEASE